MPAAASTRHLARFRAAAAGGTTRPWYRYKVVQSLAPDVCSPDGATVREHTATTFLEVKGSAAGGDVWFVHMDEGAERWRIERSNGGFTARLVVSSDLGRHRWARGVLDMTWVGDLDELCAILATDNVG